MPVVRWLAALVFGLLLAACQLRTVPGPSATAVLPLASPTALPAAELAPTPSGVRQPSAATATLTPTLPENDIAAVALAQARGLPRDAVRLARAFRGLRADAASPTLTPAEDQAIEQFWVTDIPNNAHYTVTARLRYQSESLLFYAADDVAVDAMALQRSATVFAEETLPRLLDFFQQQVEAPPRISVLLAPIPGVGGYYSSEDELPAEVSPRSNQRPMIYMNSNVVQPGTSSFDRILAHEMQHLLHHRLRSNASLWFNEGLSMVVERRLGHGSGFAVEAFLQNPDLQLNSWADRPDKAITHYGAADLFLSYLEEQAGDVPWAELARAGAGDQLELLPPLTGSDDLGDLIADWAVANVLNDPQVADGRFAYESLPHPVQPVSLTSATEAGEVHQLGADYLLIPPADQPRQLIFEGAQTVPVTAAPLAEGETAWWSGRGDGRVAVLTRTLDLRGLSEATLRYQVWFDLEQGYDYAFVAASTDQGRTWQALRTRYGTRDNPHGLNYGYGYTGKSGASADGAARWLEDAVDLTPFSGGQVQVGFWVVNDQGYHAPGVMLRDLAVAELGQPIADGWHATGFVAIQNRLPQRWEVRLVLLGDASEVRSVEVRDGRAEAVVPPGMRAVLVVMAAAPETTETGTYRVRLLP